MGKPKSRVSNVRIRGPLAPFIASLRARLREEGYTPLSSVNQLRLMAHLSRWLEAKGLTVADLTEDRVEEFFVARRAEGCTWALSRQSLVPLLDVLSAQGVLPPAAAALPAESAAQSLITAFRRYLLTERGLSPSTVEAYTSRASRFLGSYAADGQLDALTAAHVTHAVLVESTRVSAGATQYFVAALRSFLRFCRVEGLVQSDLSAAALAMTGRRRSALPRGISARDAAALLRSCDRRQTKGRRDHAVLTMLIRLGLRASEVAMLTLDDIDWRAAEVGVRGKGQREERLPLLDDVGEALAAYLRWGRPKTDRREVFLRTLPPLHGLGRGGVSLIVRRASRRAGLVPFGAHRLRHTLACAMAGAGVPLPMIGQVLRHRDLATTMLYAQVDVGRLRALARPWPGESSR